MATKEPLVTTAAPGYGTAEGVSVEVVAEAGSTQLQDLEQQDRAAEREQMQVLLNMLGPPFARTHAFWLGMLTSVIMGVVMGVVALVFFNFF